MRVLVSVAVKNDHELSRQNVYPRGIRHLAMEKALGPEHHDVDPRQRCSHAHLDWMREAGFETVECLLYREPLALIVATA
jgi:hypothetical protein